MDRAEHEPGFDSLRAAETLRETGIEDRQAKVIAGAVRDGRRGLATKADLDNLEARLDAKIDAKIERAVNLLTWRFVVGMIALASVIVATAGVVVAIVR